MLYLRNEIFKVIANLAEFAQQYKSIPILGYTHYPPAQLVTVGKRTALWMYDSLSDISEIDYVIANIKFLRCRGTTGTETSFMELLKATLRRLTI